jgi:hypothetical protein
VIVAVAEVCAMEMAIDEIVDVIAVRHGRVAAAFAVNVTGAMSVARVTRGAQRRIGGVDRDRTLVDVIAVRGVKMPVVHVVDVVVVANGDMTAAVAVDMRVVDMGKMSNHGLPSSLYSTRSTHTLIQRFMK